MASADVSAYPTPRAHTRALARGRERAGAAVGAAALAAVVGLALVLVLVAADRPSSLSPFTQQDFFPSWMAGPLGGLLPSLTRDGLTLDRLASAVIGGMFVAYVLAVVYAPRLRARWGIAAIVAVNVLFVLAPPLFSSDIFNYLNYGRMGAVHGLNPYVVLPALEPHSDPTFALSNWHGLLSPYGELFTLLTYALVPLGVQASFWIIKVIIALASLAMLALVWRCAELLGRPPLPATLFVGLNPLVLVWGLGADHNDALMMLFVVVSIYLALRSEQRRGEVRPAAGPEPHGAGAARLRLPARPRLRLRAGGIRFTAATAVAGAGPAATLSAPALVVPPLQPPAAAASGVAAQAEAGPDARAARRLAAASGAAIVVAIAIKASAGVLLPVILLSGQRRAKLAGAAGAAVVLGVVSYLAFGTNLPDLSTQSSLVTPPALANLLGLALGLGGENAGLHTALTVVLVLAVAVAAIVTLRWPERWLAAAFGCVFVLLATLSWSAAWYVLWLLPFAALLPGRGPRLAALALSAYLLVAFMPAQLLVSRPLRLPLYTTSLGQVHETQIEVLQH